MRPPSSTVSWEAALRRELGTLPEHVATPWKTLGFGDEWLIERAHTVGRSHRIAAPCAPPPAPTTWRSSALQRRLGEELLARGQVALCVLAGGMATRMGSVVKALVELAPGYSFLDARLHEQQRLAARYGSRPPLWLMVSDATAAPIEAVLASHAGGDPALAGLHTFHQNLSLRLSDRALFRLASGAPSLHATGHGDVVDGLRRSGVLARFVAHGGRYVVITNLDNLGATLDPEMIGAAAHADTPLVVEVCDKHAGDRGGIPVRVGGGTQLVEEFRLPESFDPQRVSVFNTNTMIVEASRLLRVDVAWSWFCVEKRVEERPALQFERLIGELSGALPTTYLRVPRSGLQSRFLPVKNADELEARRDQILAVLQARGIR